MKYLLLLCFIYSIEAFIPSNSIFRSLNLKNHVVERQLKFSSSLSNNNDFYQSIHNKNTLSMIVDNVPKAKTPLKIAVAGAGIGGVFTGYALQQKGFDVTVFEKASKFSRFGGPIQLASNAL